MARKENMTLDEANQALMQTFDKPEQFDRLKDLFNTVKELLSTNDSESR